MYRYLMNIAYIGTPFRGAQRQIKYTDTVLEDLSTVQGRMEVALKTLKPRNEIAVKVSSRTDTGVHALQTTMHVDLEPYSGRPYPTEIVTVTLNRYFGVADVPIRALSTFLVPNYFNSRFAKSRTYMYRLFVVKGDTLHESNLGHFVPIEEQHRSLFKCTNTFDVDSAREAASLFLGRHDFRTFMGRSPSRPDKLTRRVITRLDIEENGLPEYSAYTWPWCVSPNKNDYRGFRIFIESSGFLYKQVRRIVATLIAVAQGELGKRDVRLMLEVPSYRSWPNRLKVAPAHGLYLCQVTYPKELVETFKTKW